MSNSPLKRVKILATVSAVSLVIIYFLFFTAPGVYVQSMLAVKLDSNTYRRFLAYRMAAFRCEQDPMKDDDRVLAAKMLVDVAGNDLAAASEILGPVVTKRQASVYYAQRGSIYMQLKRYRDAREDFEAAVKNWRGSSFTTSPLETYSNSLLEAGGCLEAQQKARANATNKSTDSVLTNWGESRSAP